MDTGEPADEKAELEGSSVEEIRRYGAIARQLVFDSIEEVHRCKMVMREGDDSAHKELNDAIKALNGAIRLLFQERERIEKVIHGFEAGRRSPAIDFNQARQEIERRMDSLRTARDQEGLS